MGKNGISICPLPYGLGLQLDGANIWRAIQDPIQTAKYSTTLLSELSPYENAHGRGVSMLDDKSLKRLKSSSFSHVPCASRYLHHFSKGLTCVLFFILLPVQLQRRHNPAL